ncbi:MAG: hypothetical protein CL870_02690 [Cytophagia bacterium]|nr:hypothetical protein [Cytophagia bacterium]
MKLLKNKKYSFCTCGFSKKIPFCDNRHREYNLRNKTNYKSFKIIPDKDLNVKVSSSTWKS